MAIRTYTCAEVSIAHADFVALRRADAITLGIGNAAADTIAKTRAFWPKYITFKPASNRRNVLAVAVFALSIYLAFIDEWWHIVFGLAFMLLLGRNHHRLNVEKILAAAEVDAEFYEQHRAHGSWLYRMDEDKAAPFVR